MPKLNFPEPPLTGKVELDRYLLELHNVVFGIGAAAASLDASNNVTPSSAFAAGHNASTGAHLPGVIKDTNIDWGVGAGQVNTDDVPEGSVNEYFPGPAGAVADATASSVSVTSADADGTYDANEQTLINELKGDVNGLVSDFNNLVSRINVLLASLRAGGLLN